MILIYVYLDVCLCLFRFISAPSIDNTVTEKQCNDIKNACITACYE